MGVLEKVQDTARELFDVQDQLQALNVEHAGLSAQMREAMAAGDEQAFLKARERAGAITRDSYALQVQSLELELQYAKQRRELLEVTLPPEAVKERHELDMQIRDIEQHQLPGLLAQDGMT